MVDSIDNQKSTEASGWVGYPLKDGKYIDGVDKLIHRALYYSSLDGHIISVNKAFEELTGYTNDALAGQPTSILFANKEGYASLEGQTTKTGGVDAGNLSLLLKDNREVPVTVHTALLNTDEGNPHGYVATFTEVAQDQQMQRKIERAATEWRATLDAITDMVWICDKDCQLLRVNRAYANLIGMDPKLVIGKTCSSLFSWANVLCPSCPHKQTMATGESATKEFHEPDKDACLEVSTSPILNEKGEAIATVCVARDITNRKRAEKQIQSLNRLTRYFSPKVAERLISDEGLYKVRRKNMTIFFADIRGSTKLSDEVEPEELLSMLNEFFTQMTEIIFNYGGTVGKFIGDAIMGFFGDPEDCPNQAELAVKMALEMQAKAKTLNETSLLWNDFPLSIGIGIDTGYVTVGNVGSANHMDYTVIGRHVNLAARLEEEAKPGQVLISQRTYALVASLVKAEEVGNISVKGFEKPVLVHNVLGLA